MYARMKDNVNDSKFSKCPLNYQYTLRKMKDRKVKQILFGSVQAGRETEK
jgi:hypothetical protein